MSEINTWSTTAANNNSAPPNGWPENMNYSDVNNSARENMAAVAKWYADTNGTLTTAGTANTYTLTPNRTIAAYTAGLRFVFKLNATNTGAATLNVSALGAKALNDMDGAALASGVLVINRYYHAFYQGTYFIVSPYTPSNYAHPNHSGDVTSLGDGAQTIVADAVTTTKVVNNAITNAKAADVPTGTMKGRATAGTGDPEDLTPTQARGVLQLGTAALKNTGSSGDAVPLLNIANTFSGAQRGAVTALSNSAATVAVNLATNNNMSLTTGSVNHTLGAPTNPVAGQSGQIVITQGATPRLMAYNTFWKFGGGIVPDLTATAGAVDVLVYYIESATRGTCSLLKDFK